MKKNKNVKMKEMSFVGTTKEEKKDQREKEIREKSEKHTRRCDRDMIIIPLFLLNVTTGRDATSQGSIREGAIVSTPARITSAYSIVASSMGGAIIGAVSGGNLCNFSHSFDGS